MNLRMSLIVIAATALLASCAGNPVADRAAAGANQNLDKAGSPYRWRVIHTDGGGALMVKELIGKPSESAADPVLAADITRLIGQAELQSGGVAIPTILETQFLSDSANERREVWVVARNDKKVAYVVYLSPSNEGGTSVRVSGPWN